MCCLRICWLRTSGWLPRRSLHAGSLGFPRTRTAPVREEIWLPPPRAVPLREGGSGSRSQRVFSFARRTWISYEVGCQKPSVLVPGSAVGQLLCTESRTLLCNKIRNDRQLSSAASQSAPFLQPGSLFPGRLSCAVIVWESEVVRFEWLFTCSCGWKLLLCARAAHTSSRQRAAHLVKVTAVIFCGQRLDGITSQPIKMHSV